MSIKASLSLMTLVAVCVLGAAPAFAQGGGQPQPVRVTTTKFGNNFYAIDGRGGRMGALVGPEGVFLVDAQFPDVTDSLVAAIRRITDRPLRLLVNTHMHGDHTGGNANFATRFGVTIMSRPLLRERLARPSGNPPTPPAAGALPIVTYDEHTTIHMNGEVIELIPLRGAHTDGDTGVKFRNHNVLMTGDVYRSTGYPFFDRNNGGTLNGLLAALSALALSADENTTVVPGHGPITNRAAIVAHREMAITVRDRVARMIAEGRTMEQIVAAKPTADFDERVGSPNTADRFVQGLYQELTGAGR